MLDRRGGVVERRSGADPPRHQLGERGRELHECENIDRKRGGPRGYAGRCEREAGGLQGHRCTEGCRGVAVLAVVFGAVVVAAVAVVDIAFLLLLLLLLLLFLLLLLLRLLPLGVPVVRRAAPCSPFTQQVAARSGAAAALRAGVFSLCARFRR